MHEDNPSKPVGEQKPPVLEELASNFGGKVLTASGNSVPQLYWTVSEASNLKKPSDRYALDKDLRLLPVFQSDLSDILQLPVVTQSAAFNNEEGRFVADRLRPFIERVQHLLDSDSVEKRSPEETARTRLILGNALLTVADQSGDNRALSQAVGLYQAALDGFLRKQFSLDWAGTQNNLDAALDDLGERESDIQHLTEAVAAYRAALLEYTPDRVPLYWATTQNNLGIALSDLGERTNDPATLCQALENHVAAWRVFSKADPYAASKAAVAGRLDTEAIHDLYSGSTCPQVPASDLKRMGITN